jgi:hypothetical protein
MESAMILSRSQADAILETNWSSTAPRYVSQSVPSERLVCEVDDWCNPGEIDLRMGRVILFDDLLLEIENLALEMEREAQSYRVVGTNADNNRITLDEGLAKQRAEEIRSMLLFANAFPTVGIEPE